MKKKFLSLMMAAAVVATTSVSAFAATATGSKDITGDETKEHNTEISITGDVENKDGNVKPGTLSVTVPTAAAFRVDRDGHLEGAELQVSNKGSQAVEVLVTEFVDINGTTGINVVPAKKTAKANGEDEAVNRSNVSLNIVGNRGVAYLGTRTSNDQSGVYSDENLENLQASGVKVSEIAATSQDTLRLSGQAGQKTEQINEAIRDNFTLKLMIKKKA